MRRHVGRAMILKLSHPQVQARIVLNYRKLSLCDSKVYPDGKPTKRARHSVLLKSSHRCNYKTAKKSVKLDLRTTNKLLRYGCTFVLDRIGADSRPCIDVPSNGSQTPHPPNCQSEHALALKYLSLCHKHGTLSDYWYGDPLPLGYRVMFLVRWRRDGRPETNQSAGSSCTRRFRLGVCSAFLASSDITSGSEHKEETKTIWDTNVSMHRKPCQLWLVYRRSIPILALAGPLVEQLSPPQSMQHQAWSRGPRTSWECIVPRYYDCISLPKPSSIKIQSWYNLNLKSEPRSAWRLGLQISSSGDLTPEAYRDVDISMFLVSPVSK